MFGRAAVLDHPDGAVEQRPGPRDVAPAPMVHAGEQVQADRQLGVEPESLRLGAQLGQVLASSPGSRRRMPGCNRTWMSSSSARTRRAADASRRACGAPERHELLGVADRQGGERSAGRRGRMPRCTSPSRRRRRRGERYRRPGCRRGRAGRREPPRCGRGAWSAAAVTVAVGRGPHQVVDEVDVAVLVGAKHAVALQVGECLEQLGWLAVGDGGEQARRKRAPEGGGPWHERERILVEPGQAITDERIDAARQRVLAPGERSGHLDGEERVAVRHRGDARGVGSGGDLLGQLGDRRRRQRADRQLVQDVVTAERFDERAGRQRCRRARRARAVATNATSACGEVPDREVEERSGRFVEPVDVVEQDGDRMTARQGWRAPARRRRRGDWVHRGRSVRRTAQAGGGRAGHGRRRRHRRAGRCGARRSTRRTVGRARLRRRVRRRPFRQLLQDGRSSPPAAAVLPMPGSPTRSRSPPAVSPSRSRADTMTDHRGLVRASALRPAGGARRADRRRPPSMPSTSTRCSRIACSRARSSWDGSMPSSSPRVVRARW